MRFPDDVPVLTDGGVTLRAHHADDLGGMFEQCTDPASVEYTTVPSPYTPEDAAQFLARRAGVWESGSAWSFAIETEGGAGPRRFAGSIGIRLTAPGIGEIGFGAHPDVRGRGVTTAAVRLVTDWAFDSQGLDTVVWRAVVGNVASRRVAWKAGFTFEPGTTRGSHPQRGKVRDGWRATLLTTDPRTPTTRWLVPVVLSDDRVRLRPLCPEDGRRYVETNTDPESLRWLSAISFPRDPLAFARHYANSCLGPSTGASVEWVIADADDDEYLGTVNLFGFHSLDYRSAEVGYRTHPDARGRGALTAGLRLALGHAFTAEDGGGLGLERVSLGAGDGNVGSQAVARACGFTETGRDRRSYDLYGGSVVDLVRFDLLRSEWTHPTKPARRHGGWMARPRHDGHDADTTRR